MIKLYMLHLRTQTATIPHQAAASAEQYAVSTKAVNKTSEEQPPRLT